MIEGEKFNRNILIAGAGHGGLLAGALLSEKGYKVTVYEKEKEEDLGYPWHDDLYYDTFEECGLFNVPRESVHPKDNACFISPDLKSMLETYIPDSERTVAIHRKRLCKELIQFGRERNLQFKFESKVVEPIIENDVIVGFIVEKDGNKNEVRGDLIIDSAGINTSIRTQLPNSYKIIKNLERGEIFYTYRGYFNLINKRELLEQGNMFTKNGNHWHKNYFGFNNIRGIGWYRIDNGDADVLFGGMDPINEEEIEIMLEKMRQINPSCGTTLKHGGFITLIPVRKTLERFIGQNYVAIGDSASMVVPIQGSGLDHSFHAATMLAEIIIDIGKQSYSSENLWKFQYEYFQTIGAKMASVDYLKTYLTSIPLEDLDYLFKNKLIKSEDMEAAISNIDVEISFFDILGRVLRGFRRIGVLINLKYHIDKMKKANEIALTIPKYYDEQKIDAWSHSLENVFANLKKIIKST